MSAAAVPAEDPRAPVDSPRATFSMLSRRVTVLTVLALVGLAAVAWWSTVDTARGMGDMADGIARVGMMEALDVTAAVFLGMWVVMMVAMMFPTIAPMVLAHRMVLRKRGEGLWPTVAFVLGYLVIWALAGLVPLAAVIGFRDVGDGATWLPYAGGAVLIVAGLYQFTRWKMACLRACRSPMTFLMTHDFRSGARGAARAGVSHGAFCLGCCWALMSVLVVVGLMNLVWMAGIALVFLAEKTWRHGVGLTRVMGLGLSIAGVVVLFDPDALRVIARA